MAIALSLIVFFCLNLSLLPILEGQLPLPITNSNITTLNLDIHIVHVQKPSGTKFHLFKHRKEWYKSFLPNATLFSGEPRLVYAYRQVITGFAAWLTQEELTAIESMNGFLLAHPDKELDLRTTYTPKFLGLDESRGLWHDSGYGQGQIIGVIDRGVTPGHPSFSGDGMPPPPPNWNGGPCKWGAHLCNNKIIGAKTFSGGPSSNPPIDTNGHGSHCASIAAGNFVNDAEILGTASGKSAGIAPKAHLAIYKVGKSSDLIKAIDEAIGDKVDVLSLSRGDAIPDFYANGIVMGSFTAITNGILTSAAVPNKGPLESSMDNDAPWMLTVGAAATDRRITATVKLGDGREFDGESAYQPSNYGSPQLTLLNFPRKSKGKILLLESQSNNTEKSIDFLRIGAAALIFRALKGNTTYADPYWIPVAFVNEYSGHQILDYSYTPNSTAGIIFKGTQFGALPAPAVAIFSGRGPSPRNGGIIKPDVIAPGVNILAAWPYEVGPNPTGRSQSTFTFNSGSSMATPHVAGLVALLKANHPKWSAAAIKSAIMTTAQATDRDGNPITDQKDGKTASVFAMGSGHINPPAANDPGLIYDIDPHDYIRYLCGSGLFSDEQVNAIIRGNITCSMIKGIKPEELNYPSIGVSLGADSASKTVTRTVTNVGEADSTYKVDFDNPKGVNIVVSPPVLHFTQLEEKKTFDVTLSFKSIPMPAGEVSSGQLYWDSGKYLARSPIAVSFT